MSPSTAEMSQGQNDSAVRAAKSASTRLSRRPPTAEPLGQQELLDRIIKGLKEFPVFFTDARGKILGLSPKLERLLRHAPSEILGRSAIEFLFGSRIEKKEILEKLILHERVAGREVCIRAKSGRKVRCKLTASIIKDSEGRVAGVVGSLQDLLEYSVKDSASDPEFANEKEARRKTPQAVIWLDNRNRIVRWGKSAERIFGYNEQETTGRWLSLILPDRRTRYKISSMMRESESRGSSNCKIEVDAATKGGRLLRLDTTWTLLRDEAGEPIGKEVAIETSASEATRASPGEGDDSKHDSARERAALVAHEVKSPLASIYLNVEMLGSHLEFIPDESIRCEAYELVESVRKEVEHLRVISHKYLKGPGDLRMSFSRQPLHEMLFKLQRFMHKEMEIRNIKFVNEFCSGMSDILFDRNRLKEAILNLYENSADAMPGGGEIHTTTKISHNWAEIRISDTGSGVPESDVGRLFKPFFTTKVTGTGLGLVIVEDILKAHRGTVEVRQVPAGGTLFLLRLPLDC